MNMLSTFDGLAWAGLIFGGMFGSAQAVAALQSPAGPEAVHAIRSSDLANKGTAVLTGDWILQGDLRLGGDVQLTFRHAHVNLEGNLFLADRAVLSIEESSIFNLAQTQSFQYQMEAKGRSSLRVADSEFQTNAGKNDILLPASFVASDDASLVVRNAHLNYKRNWFLGAFKDRARLVSVNTQYLPVEIYPEGECTVQVEGRDSKSLVWIKFIKDQFVILDDLPNTSQPYTWSLGRSRPKKTNVKYDLDVKDAPLGINVQSETGSDIKIANNQSPLGIGYAVEGLSEPIVGLEGGAERQNFSTTNGRRLTIIDSLVDGWQFYASHSSQPVILKDSTINEAIANDQGIIHAKNCKFLYGGLGTFGQGAQFDVDDSDIRAFSLLANKDSVVTIRDSTIHGSTIQASDRGRIVLLNNDITTNGNPYFGEANAPAHFVAEDAGVIVGLGLVVMKPASLDEMIHFSGDAFLETHLAALSGTYNLSYSKTGETTFTPITRNAPLKQHAGILGTLNGHSLSPGSYNALLEGVLSDGTHLKVTRHFSIKESNVK